MYKSPSFGMLDSHSFAGIVISLQGQAQWHHVARTFPHCPRRTWAPAPSCHLPAREGARRWIAEATLRFHYFFVGPLGLLHLGHPLRQRIAEPLHVQAPGQILLDLGPV